MITDKETTQTALSKEQYSVFSCLCYFDIFDYPMRLEEIQAHCSLVLDLNVVSECLEDLQDCNLVFSKDGYYLKSNSLERSISRRLKSEKRFTTKLTQIKKYTQLVAKFPFVEFVGVSGSCARGLFEKTGDVDYFIITQPNRLWVARTLLVLYKKLFLFNSHTYFCVNYFVDSEHLEIPDKNIFVAHEILAISPVNNQELFDRFKQANNWVLEYLPNKKFPNDTLKSAINGKPVFSRLIQKVLAGKLGAMLDAYFLKITVSNWRKKFPQINDIDFEIRFRSTPHVSKHHPRGFQSKVLATLKSALASVHQVA